MPSHDNLPGPSWLLPGVPTIRLDGQPAALTPTATPFADWLKLPPAHLDHARVRDAILQRLDQALERWDFRRNSANDAYWHFYKEGRVAFAIAFGGLPRITAHVAVRLEALETLVNRDNAGLFARHKVYTNSMVVDVQDLPGGGNRRWTVESAADAPGMAAEIARTFHAAALPFLDQAMTLEGAIRILANPCHPAWLRSATHGGRAKRLVGLLSLAGAKKELSHAIQQQGEQLRRSDDSGLREFREFTRQFVRPAGIGKVRGTTS